MNWGPFEDKRSGGFSARRLIAILTALAVDAALVVVAITGHFHEVTWSWPLVAVVLGSNIALGLSEWLMTRTGSAALAKVVDTLHDKFGSKEGQP